MKRAMVVTTAIALSAALAACGSSSAKSWTVAKVQSEYNDQLRSDVNNVGRVDASCVLESGAEGKLGKLLCHLDYANGDSGTAEIVVPPNGDWIAHGV